MNSVFDKFFYPKSICVAGASSKPKSLGYELTKSIKKFRYRGSLYLVNPKSEEILGYKCYPDVNSIIGKIDLGIVMVPKQFVEQTLKDLAAKSVKAIILITAGFKETGNEGLKDEERILQLIKNSDARMVGPNCMGIINTKADIKMNATFVAEKPLPGSIAFCSQSGAIGAAVLNSLRETDIRFSHFISVGNKADVSENDLLEYWQQDKNVNVITFYLESFEDGENFLKYFINERITKPVIILKGGRTAGGMKAASSHTGALGSSDKVVDSVLKQFGILRANNLNELFNSAKGFEEFPFPAGNRIAVVTNAGGPAILAADSLAKNSLTLAELTVKTKTRLREVVPPQGSVNNPVDLLPGGTAEQFQTVNKILVDDENIDAVISVFVEPVMVSALPVIEAINSIESKKPIMQVVMPLPEFWENYRRNSKSKRSLFRNPEDPSVVISNQLRYINKLATIKRLKPDTNYLKQISFRDFKNEFISTEKVEEICMAYKLPIINSQIIDAKEIRSAEVEYPLVLKAVGEQIIHKSELKGVALNIKNKNELLEKVDEMNKSFKKKNLLIESFLIQPFIKPKFELLLGGFRDPNFGPMVMFGSGGIYVEYLDDTVMRSAYLSKNDVDEIIIKTKIGKILKGVRGENAANISSITSTINSVAQMMLDNKEIMECDLNPLILSDDGSIFAVDVRIKVA